jgi:hypothetical protein
LRFSRSIDVTEFDQRQPQPISRPLSNYRVKVHIDCALDLGDADDLLPERRNERSRRHWDNRFGNPAPA